MWLWVVSCLQFHILLCCFASVFALGFWFIVSVCFLCVLLLLGRSSMKEWFELDGQEHWYFRSADTLLGIGRGLVQLNTVDFHDVPWSYYEVPGILSMLLKSPLYIDAIEACGARIQYTPDHQVLLLLSVVGTLNWSFGVWVIELLFSNGLVFLTCACVSFLTCFGSRPCQLYGHAMPLKWCISLRHLSHLMTFRRPCLAAWTKAARGTMLCPYCKCAVWFLSSFLVTVWSS